MIVTFFDKVQHAYTTTEQIMDRNWSEVASILTSHQDVKNKEEAWLFNLWEFNQNGEQGQKRIYKNNMPTTEYRTIPGTIRCSKSNAKNCSGIVLDYDGQTTIDKVINDLSSFAFLIYTTFRHTPEMHKFRVVIPFKEARSYDVLKAKKKSISSTFKDVDHASFSESQCFYLHSGSLDYAFTYINDGAFLDLDWFADEVIEAPHTQLVRREFSGDANAYKDRLMTSLYECHGLHYANESSEYGVLTLVALCKSAGCTYDEFNTICYNMAAPDSSLKDESYRKSAWIGWAPFSGITAKVRDKFLTTYGGIPISKAHSGSTISKRQDRINELKELLK